MKQINQKIFIAAVVVGGLFIGAVKGQEARSSWVKRMKGRDERKMKAKTRMRLFLMTMRSLLSTTIKHL
jgi:hypothetical protein